MAKIRLKLNYAPVDGQHLSFRAPCASDEAECLVINDTEYAIVDTIGRTYNRVSSIWKVNALVSVILDTTRLRATIQNAPLVAELLEGTAPVNRGGTGATTAAQARVNLGAAPAYGYGTEDLIAGESTLAPGTLYFVYEVN